MNSGIAQAILVVGGSWALSTLVKATLVAALGLCAVELAGRKRAAFRHAILAATFGVLLALPVVSAIAPTLGIAAPGRAAASVSTLRGADSWSTIAAGGGRVEAPESSRWSMGELLAAGWMAGIVVFLLPAGAGVAHVLRLRRTGMPWQHGQSVANPLAAGAGIRRRVEVLLHEKLQGPMTCGLGRSSIVLPADAPGWDTGDLDRALVHELEHVSRRDWAIHCGARAVCALYWFHPLAWLALRRLELEAEQACDDEVLEHSEATAYADQLVTAARRISASAQSPLLAMAGRADLASRVRAVLDSRRRRGRAGVWTVTGVAAASAALALAVSPLRVVAAPQEGGGAPVARLRTETRLVVTQVKVSYPNGRPVEGLSASDFEVTEDGVAQSLRICEFQKTDATDPDSGFYLLGYYPRSHGADGQFRKINVVVKTATVAKVEHRAGYVLTQTIGLAQSTVTPRPVARREAPPYDRAPVLIFKQEPEYSEAARNAKYQGTVLLDMEVGDSGLPVSIRVARSLGLGLDEKAIEAVKLWRFKPASKDGKALAAKTQVEVIFRLP